jgi:hypothetical protein
MMAGALPLLLGIGVKDDRVIIETGRAWVVLTPAEALAAAEVLVQAAVLAEHREAAEVH